MTEYINNVGEECEDFDDYYYNDSTINSFEDFDDDFEDFNDNLDGYEDEYDGEFDCNLEKRKSHENEIKNHCIIKSVLNVFTH